MFICRVKAVENFEDIQTPVQLLLNHAEEWWLHKSNLVIFSPSAVAALIHHSLPQNFHKRSGSNDQKSFTAMETPFGFLP